MLAGQPNAQARQQALQLLQALDVATAPAPCPPGCRRRAAAGGDCASAGQPAAGDPADEPTAPLDSERALAVIRILNQMAQQFHTAVIVVTRRKIIPTFKRIYQIRDGPDPRAAGPSRPDT